MMEMDPFGRCELYVFASAHGNTAQNNETMCGPGFWSSNLRAPSLAQLSDGDRNPSSAPNIETDNRFTVLRLTGGVRGIEVRYKKNNEIKIGLIYEGARGKKFKELEAHAKRNLGRAGILKHSDFKDIAEALLTVIRGLKVDEVELKTKNKAHRLLFSFLREGVWVDGAFSSWAYFYRDENNVVYDVLVAKDSSAWFDRDYLHQTVLLGEGIKNQKRTT
jgi:hypothetical protein